MRKLTSILPVLALAGFCVVGVACKKSETTVDEHLSEAGQEMKEAGKDMAQAGEKVGNAAVAAGEDVGQATEEATEEAAIAAEKAGENLKEGAEKAGENLKEGAENAAEAAGDATITTRVKGRLLADPEVKAVKIDVDTVGGVVTLTGTAATRAQAQEAVKLARNTEGVKSVVDNIQVSG